MKYNSHRLLKHTLSLFYILGNRCPQYVFCFSTQIYASLEHTKIGFLDENARIYKKKYAEYFVNSKRVPTFATAKEKNTLRKQAKLRLGRIKLGPFVYRLGRKIFILERGVRFPHGLQIKIIKEQN